MIPRLRFVIAAIVIAMLPMVIFSAAPYIGPSHPDAVRPPSTLGPSDARAAQQVQALAYGRRADELTRLRDMASAPLAAWVAAPAGTPPAGNVTAGNAPSGSSPPSGDRIAAAPPAPAVVQAPPAPAPIVAAPAVAAPVTAALEAAPPSVAAPGIPAPTAENEQPARQAAVQDKTATDKIGTDKAVTDKIAAADKAVTDTVLHDKVAQNQIVQDTQDKALPSEPQIVASLAVQEPPARPMTPPVAMTNEEPQVTAALPSPVEDNRSKPEGLESSASASEPPLVVAELTPPTLPLVLKRLPPQFIPPLPKARPRPQVVRRAAAVTPAPADPNPFGGFFDAFNPKNEKPSP